MVMQIPGCVLSDISSGCLKPQLPPPRVSGESFEDNWSAMSSVDPCMNRGIGGTNHMLSSTVVCGTQSRGSLILTCTTFGVLPSSLVVLSSNVLAPSATAWCCFKFEVSLPSRRISTKSTCLSDDTSRVTTSAQNAVYPDVRVKELSRFLDVDVHDSVLVELPISSMMVDELCFR